MTKPLRSGIGRIFEHDDTIRTAVAGHLRVRGQASRERAERAEAAFGRFSPSRFTEEQRAQQDYLGPGDELGPAMTATIGRGVDAMRGAETETSLRLTLTDELRGLLEPADGDALGTIALGTLHAYLARRLGAGFGGSGGRLTAYAAAAEAERMLAEIEDPGGKRAAGRAGSVAEDDDEDTGGQHGDPAAAMVATEVALQPAGTTTADHSTPAGAGDIDTCASRTACASRSPG
ncbi:hypothetical protein [Dactylosporangium darangshiense]|uniref:Uncharacterized protein n=1 Tax=Dactylosporangium darangshiense TaxID=579108 RepID=A0ABP8DHB7_9ACTN